MRRPDVSVGGAPSVSSIRSRSSSFPSERLSTPPFHPIEVRGVGKSGLASPPLVRATPVGTLAEYGEPLANRSPNVGVSAVGDIGREARELAARLHVELSQIRSSVDLLFQTDKALVLSADRHFHGTVKMWHDWYSQRAQQQQQQLPPPHNNHHHTASVPPAFHFLPTATAPQLTLRMQDSRQSPTVHPFSSRRGRLHASRGEMNSGVVEMDTTDFFPQYRIADQWNGDGSHKQQPLQPRRSASAESKPRWNVSTQHVPGPLDNPPPLSVEEPTKDWLQKRVATRQNTDDRRRQEEHRGGASAQKRSLRFESPDGTITAVGSKPGEAEHQRKQQQHYKDPVTSGLLNESLDRVQPPHAYGRTTTGLWSQRAGDTHVPQRSPGEALMPAYGPRDPGPSVVVGTTNNSGNKAQLGSIAAKTLGLSEHQHIVSLGESGQEAEMFARRQLHAMNIDISSQGPSAMDSPLWCGAVLCHLVNIIVRQFATKQQLREIPVRIPPGLSFDEVKANYVNALSRIRELHVPSSAEPIPPRLLYLDPKEIVGGASREDLWSLIAHLVEAFVLRGSSSSNSAGAPSSPDGGNQALARSVDVGMLSKFPILGRYCDTYSARNMSLLEESVCQFLYSLHVLVEPVLHGMPADDHRDTTTLIPGPTAAPFLPEKRLKWHIRTTPLRTISVPSVFPFLTNGTVLCDVVSHVLGIDVTTFRNPRIRSSCLSNIRAAQDALLRHYPSRISNLFLCDPVPVADGDKAFILLLLEDVMRLDARAPPRKCRPNEDQVPFLLPEKWTIATSAAKSSHEHKSTGGARNAPGAQLSSGDAQDIDAEAANASHAALFTQQERQAFVSDPRQPKWTLAELAMQREGSVGSIGSHDADQAPFTSTQARQPPTNIHLRAIGVTTTAPSSGRSIVPSDESPHELHDDLPEPPALLPRHLEYLLSMHVEEKELIYLADWLRAKLGKNYHYASADGSFEVTSRDLKLSHPCNIFSDGVLLTHLIRVLSYHKCPQLDNVQASPKSTAAKRNNVRKVLDYLRTEKKTLVDYVFLEDVIVSGDLRAVVLVLRALRSTYRNHITAPPPAR